MSLICSNFRYKKRRLNIGNSILVGPLENGISVRYDPPVGFVLFDARVSD